MTGLNKKMVNENYTFYRLRSDLKADMMSYAKNLLNLKNVSFGSGVKIIFIFPTLWLIAFYRYGFWVDSRFENKFLKFFLKFFNYVGKRIIEVITKSTIYNKAKIGPGLCLAGKSGITLGVKKTGRECIIYENVTIGMDRSRHLPELGDFVKVGPNTVISGGIKIGNGVRIAESTVLTKSVPDFCIVQGNPGRIVKNMNSVQHYARKT